MCAHVTAREARRVTVQGNPVGSPSALSRFREAQGVVHRGLSAHTGRVCAVRWGRESGDDEPFEQVSAPSGRYEGNMR
jgi:hypothetical protein